MTNQYFSLFADCLMIKGVSQSTICDMSRQRYRVVSNTLYEILMECKTKSIGELKERYNDNDEQSVIGKYFEVLENDEWGHITQFPDNFPALDLDWVSPWQITNSIIDIGESSSKSEVFSAINQLGGVTTEALQIRAYVNLSFAYLRELVEIVNSTTVSYLEILIKYHDYCDKVEFKNLYLNNKKIRMLFIYAAPEDSIDSFNDFDQGIIFKTTTNQISKTHCGLISPNLFNLNINAVTEAVNHNSCLNRKISIDADGNIKNCPSMVESFGNIKDTTLKEAIEKPGFKKYWNITKDQIAVCKDCEFRYICTDCRAYIENPDDIYSKPLKCGYNPYTAEWEEWSTHPMKTEALQLYGI